VADCSTVHTLLFWMFRKVIPLCVESVKHQLSLILQWCRKSCCDIPLRSCVSKLVCLSAHVVIGTVCDDCLVFLAIVVVIMLCWRVSRVCSPVFQTTIQIIRLVKEIKHWLNLSLGWSIVLHWHHLTYNKTLCTSLPAQKTLITCPQKTLITCPQNR